MLRTAFVCADCDHSLEKDHNSNFQFSFEVSVGDERAPKIVRGKAEIIDNEILRRKVINAKPLAMMPRQLLSLSLSLSLFFPLSLSRSVSFRGSTHLPNSVDLKRRSVNNCFLSAHASNI